MKTFRKTLLCIAIYHAVFVAYFAFGTVECRAQQATNEARVGVGIKIGPIAQIEPAQGNGFELYIPSREEGRGPGGSTQPDQAPHLDIAEIPFEIRSNSRVTVEALPGAVLEYLQGEPIGKAFPVEQDNAAAGAVLPYRLHIEFPAKTRGRAVPGLRNGRGKNPTGSHSSTYDASGGSVSGIVYVIPIIKRADLATRGFNQPGLYTGTVQITVSAGE